MSNHRIYKDKWEYFVFVCNRDSLAYEIVRNDENNYIEVRMEISKSRFGELLEDIDCEAQRRSYKCPAPVISARTLNDPDKLHRLMEFYGSHSFRMLRRDVERFEDEKKPIEQ